MSVCVSPSRYLSLQRRVAEARQQHRGAVGDVDRTAEAELGLVEQIGEGVLGGGRIGLRPAENALAVRHRVDAEFAVGDALQLAIGRVILDPLPVAAEAVAMMQHRRVPVGEPRALVEMVARERAEPIEMRLDVPEQRVRQMELQQVAAAKDRRDRS